MSDCLSFAKLEKNLVELTLDSGCINNHVEPEESNNMNNNDLLPCIRINGRRVFGPPLNWQGKQPPTEFELFVKRLPKNLSETELLTIFQKYGQLYEFRLMVDFHSENRGFGYLRYTTETDTFKAMELLNHFYYSPFKTMCVEISYNKCRLFVGNIPKNLPLIKIENDLRQIFDDITQITIYPIDSENCNYQQHQQTVDGQQQQQQQQMNSPNLNRGFAFMDFLNHAAAVRAKQMSSSGRLRLWNRDLKIVWARMERKMNPEIVSSLKTLFVRNIDMMVNNRNIYEILAPIVNRTEIRNVSRVREIAFIDFINHEAAEIVYQELQGYQLHGREIEVQWAIPPSENSVHALKETDFDVVLRLKCLANNWPLPIYLFGQIFASQMIQYVAVISGNGYGHVAFFMEISMRCSDIQSRVAEVVVSLIGLHGYMPAHNYVLKVDDESYQILGAITAFNLACLETAQQININVSLYWNEIFRLSSGVYNLIQIPRAALVAQYNLCIHHQLTNAQLTYLPNVYSYGFDLFGCVNPEYFKKPPLKYDLNNQQIVLALCDQLTKSNYISVSADTWASVWNFRNVENSSIGTKPTTPPAVVVVNDSTDINKQTTVPIMETKNLQYRRVNLLPIKLVQSKKLSKVGMKANGVYFNFKI